jgi:hypothetical protein
MSSCRAGDLDQITIFLAAGCRFESHDCRRERDRATVGRRPSSPPRRDSGRTGRPASAPPSGLGACMHRPPPSEGSSSTRPGDQAAVAVRAGFRRSRTLGDGLLGSREGRGRRPVALDDEVDADPQLPDELRGHQHLDRALGRNDAQDDQDAHDADQRPTDQPEQGKTGGTPSRTCRPSSSRRQNEPRSGRTKVA